MPAYLPNSTRSPTLTSSGTILPVSSRAPGPTASTSPSIGFSFAVSGMMIPAGVLSSASTRRTRTRSCKGLKKIAQTCVDPGLPSLTIINESPSTHEPRHGSGRSGTEVALRAFEPIDADAGHDVPPAAILPFRQGSVPCDPVERPIGMITTLH